MRLPYVETFEDVDVAIIGVPTDDAVSYKSGARFGPEGIRSASALLRPYSLAAAGGRHRASVADRPRRLADRPRLSPGDAEADPGAPEPVHRTGVVPLCLGGDHSMVLAELRAAAAVHGPLALSTSTHTPTSGSPTTAPATSTARSSSERSRRAWSTRTPRCRPGCAGRSTARRTSRRPGSSGYDAIYWDELEQMTPDAYGDRVRARVGDRPAFLSFDIDFVDPAFAPATDARGRRPDQRRGAGLRASADRYRLPGVRLCRGRPGLRPAWQHHRLGGGERVLRDAVAAGAAARPRHGDRTDLRPSRDNLRSSLYVVRRRPTTRRTSRKGSAAP